MYAHVCIDVTDVYKAVLMCVVYLNMHTNCIV